jgi:type IV pilus assembly protein PilO
MTLSDDLNFAEQGAGSEEEASQSIVAFGITFTPLIIGGILGVLGIISSVAMVVYLIMPALDTFHQQEAKNSDLESQITQKNIQAAQLNKAQAELEKVKQQQVQVLGLFANEKSIETLLLDINRLIEEVNTKNTPPDATAKLEKYTPASEKPEIITDSSYGVLVNNKLKRLRFNITIKGTFAETETIMQKIERLTPLLIIKNYESKLTAVGTGVNKKIPKGSSWIETSCQLEALMPLTPEETASMAKIPPKK